jgi:hypothetical protein
MTPPLERPIEEYQRVKVWLDDFEKSWGGGQDQSAVELPALEAFCEFVGKDPDAVIADLLTPVEGGYEKIRYKARHRYIQLISEFEATNPGGRQAGNAVRSFLIHNGVAVGTRILR